jgi:hypothetical protein
MSTVPILQSHVDRILLLGEQLRAEVELRKVTSQWEIDRLRAEIQRRKEVIDALKS